MPIALVGHSGGSSSSSRNFAALEVSAITRERDRLIRDAYEREQDELSAAPRIDGTFVGAIS